MTPNLIVLRPQLFTTFLSDNSSIIKLFFCQYSSDVNWSFNKESGICTQDLESGNFIAALAELAASSKTASRQVPNFAAVYLGSSLHIFEQNRDCLQSMEEVVCHCFTSRKGTPVMG